MQDIIARINTHLAVAVEGFGIQDQDIEITPSNRPDLSDYQSNIALRLFKRLGRDRTQMAEDIQAAMPEDTDYRTECHGGFLNFIVSESVLLSRLNYFSKNDGDNLPNVCQTIVIDYGGPNIAKPLHIGHLRSAIIGEALKRMGRALGHTMLADIHLGDWGYNMGVVLAFMKAEYPDWDYFDSPFNAQTSQAPALTADQLNAIYPAASKRAKADPEFHILAQEMTARLQDEPYSGIRALWTVFSDISIENIKADYRHLDVSFDYWYGESHAQPFIAPMIEDLQDRGIAFMDQGALIIPVERPNDKKTIPPLILQKSNGSVGYAGTDVATLIQRKNDFDPDHVIYVVDKRQSEHFVQVFRAVDKSGLFKEAQLQHVAYGTMNGEDGKPFKTRDGGVVALSDMLTQAEALALAQTGYNHEDLDADKSDMIRAIAIGAIKFGDLQNPCYSDYQFQPEAFVKFEGKTGPYIQYAYVRAQKILAHLPDVDQANMLWPTKFETIYERTLAFQILNFKAELQHAWDLKRPDLLCSYIYGLAKAFSAFYKNCPVRDMEYTVDIFALRVRLTQMSADVLRQTCDILAIPLPREMIRKNS